MSVFDEALGIARRAKGFLRHLVRRRPTDAERRKKRATDRRRARRLTREHKERLRREIKSKKQELSLIKKGSGVAKERAHSIERKRRKKSVQQEIYELERELRAAKKRRLGSAPAAQPAPQLVREPGMGALPDFVIIGAMKGGTSYFYHLLTQHPLVEPASAKELHFFESHFDLGVEWYRRCFPPPRWEEGQWTITGEATPGYLPNRLVPERMAKVVPQARLIALLRNPVDRTYSQYQQVTRKGRQTLTFEEAIGVKKRRPGVGGETSDEGGDDLIGLAEARHKYLSKSIYVDQLLRWSEFFPKEQMLVLKSEDFFENPVESLKPVLGFLGLPDWEPETLEPRDEGDKDKFERNKRNKGTYEEGMDPATRRWLEEYFEPHNQRLYDYLGRDFGW